MEMKKIRIDFYRYRIRKGRAEVLLQKVEGKDEYCIPYHYVQAKEGIAHVIKHDRLEDDGDLVILDITMNDCHLDMKGREWIPIKQILDISLARNESFHIWHNILRFFLRLCPREGESANIERAELMLEDVKIRNAKKKYLDWLQGLLDGGVKVLDAYVESQPKPELVRREMETLEHFRLYKPKVEPMSLLDGELQDNEEYSYYPVDEAVFGCVIKPMPRLDEPNWELYKGLAEE